VTVIRARAWTFVFAAALFCAMAETAAAAEWRVDLELALAVDISSSVSTEEFRLQMGGLAIAFRTPEVVAAIGASGDLGIAVALVQWSDNRRQYLAVDWALVHDSASAHAFADRIAAAPRLVVGGGTAIGGALKFGAAQIAGNGYRGQRKVIDVSGDGHTNQGWPNRPLRDATVASGITINGLVILNEEPNLEAYYRAHVIGGTGAFVMTTMDFQSYAEAIITRLIREISGAPYAAYDMPGGDRRDG